MTSFVVDLNEYEWVDVAPEDFQVGDKVSIKKDQYFLHVINSIHATTTTTTGANSIGYTCFMRQGLGNTYLSSYDSRNGIVSFKTQQWVKLVPLISSYNPEQQADEEDDI